MNDYSCVIADGWMMSMNVLAPELWEVSKLDFYVLRFSWPRRTSSSLSRLTIAEMVAVASRLSCFVSFVAILLGHLISNVRNFGKENKSSKFTLKN